MQTAVSLANYNTLKIDVKAQWFKQASSVNDLAESIQFAHALQIPQVVIGGGSNIILKNNLQAVVTQINLKGIALIDETPTHVYIRAAAGEIWDNFICYCLEHHYYGIENLSLIPGTVGAAPIQNIGAYGVELKNIFHSLEALDKTTLQLKTFNGEACEFRYRDSIFKNQLKDQYIITAVTLKLNKQPSLVLTDKTIVAILTNEEITDPTPHQLREIVCRIRRSRLPDPNVLGNVGSFFLNPLVQHTVYQALQKEYNDIIAYPAGDNMMKISAGWLIKQCGWTGHRIGNCGVYEKNSLVLVNYGGASSEDILLLSQQIQNSVQEKFAITLEIEPRIYS